MQYSYNVIWPKYKSLFEVYTQLVHLFVTIGITFNATTYGMDQTRLIRESFIINQKKILFQRQLTLKIVVLVKKQRHKFLAAKMHQTQHLFYELEANIISYLYYRYNVSSLVFQRDLHRKQNIINITLTMN